MAPDCQHQLDHAVLDTIVWVVHCLLVLFICGALQGHIVQQGRVNPSYACVAASIQTKAVVRIAAVGFAHLALTVVQADSQHHQGCAVQDSSVLQALYLRLHMNVLQVVRAQQVQLLHCVVKQAPIPQVHRWQLASRYLQGDTHLE